MKQFVEKNFTIIVLVIALLTFFKGCSDSREISKMKNEIKQIKDSTYTKTELNIVLQIEGLKSEKRMIQATDRKMLDVQRQTEIDNEVSKLQEEVIKW
jgi:thiamine biosynthesis lipoprotein ApbE